MKPTAVALSLALLGVLVSLGLLGTRLPLPARAQATSGCEVSLARVLEPARVALDGQVAVTLSVSADCGRVQAPIHLALVVDNTSDMGGPRIEGLRQGVAALADGLDFSRSKAALVVWNSRAELLSPLTDDKAAFVAASQAFFPRPGSAMLMGLRSARQLLEAGRPPEGSGELLEVLILVAGSPAGEGLPEDAAAEQAEAQLAKDAGMLVVTVAAGGAADYDMLEAMASSSALFYIETLAGRYPSLFREIIGDVTQAELTGALVSDRLPAELEYALGSGIPAPRIRDGALTWRYAIWPQEGITVSYRAACRALGQRPSSLGAEVELSFDRGVPVTYAFPVAAIDCLPAPSPTPTPGPTAEPSASPTASPQPSPTRALAPIYLPITWRYHCLPSQRQADVVLLLDTSSSMHETAADGEIKLQLALDAASAFVDALSLPTDRAAVVAFSNRAELLHPLSGSPVSLQLALARIFSSVHVGSRVDLGLDLAQQLLAAPEPGRLPVIVLLTDGLADGPSALAAAQRARAAGITVYAVGLGDRIDAALLERLAGDGRRFFASPDGADLARIYRDIARSAGCPVP